jgi:hypothetical protein
MGDDESTVDGDTVASAEAAVGEMVDNETVGVEAVVGETVDCETVDGEEVVGETVDSETVGGALPAARNAARKNQRNAARSPSPLLEPRYCCANAIEAGA